MIIYLYKSDKPDKKYMVLIEGKKVYFGQKGYTDYILSGGDDERKKLYLKRHQSRENWTKSEIDTAGFWSRWLLWNKNSLDKSIKFIENKFDIKIVKKL